MRTIGNIERFLVIGIVVVIGAILAVAIKGAKDVDGALGGNQVAAKSTGERKSGAGDPTTLKREMPAKPTPSAPPSSPPAAAAGAGAPNGSSNPSPTAGDRKLAPEIEKALQDQQAALQGRSTKTAPQNPAPGGGVNNANSGGASQGTDANRREVAKSDLKNDAGNAPIEIHDKPLAGAKDDAASENSSKNKSPPLPATVKEYDYTVQKGDTLERIARSLYGDGALWKEILAGNPSIGDAQKIREHMVLKLPKAPSQPSSVVTTKEVVANAKSDAPAAPTHDAASTSGAKHVEPSAAAFKRITTSDSYEVQKGDTLSSIAATHYGTKAAWRLIYDANTDRIPDKDRIKSGVTLKLPAQ